MSREYVKEQANLKLFQILMHMLVSWYVHICNVIIFHMGEIFMKLLVISHKYQLVLNFVQTKRQ